MAVLCRPFVLALALVLVVSPAFAEQPVRVSVDPPRTASPPDLIRSAGYIFAGTVKSVERITPKQHDSVGAMRITFQVEKGIRGVQARQTLVIQEWLGLWEAGERYRPGERALLFLYPPSKLGLTSLVGGPMGWFPIDEDDGILLDRGRTGRLSPEIQAHLEGKKRISVEDFAHALRIGKE
jgi:hypothetical protein